MLTFSHPWLFWLLPLPLIVRWLLPAYRHARPALHVPMFQEVVTAIGLPSTGGAAILLRTPVQVVLYLLVWLAVVTALAKPQWLDPPVARILPARDLLLAVDLSGSMEVEDFQGAAGQVVDRLSAAKEVLEAFIGRRTGDRVGVIVFGNAPFVLVPFTQDLDVCRRLLRDMAPRMAGPKTALGDAVGLGISLFESSRLETRVMIVLTDGNDTGSGVPPREAARIARDKGITLYTVGMGDPTSAGEALLDESTLQAMAESTGGRYYFAGNRKQLETIYTELDRLETRRVETISHRPRQDLFHWPLAVALVLSLAYHLPLALGTLIPRKTSNFSIPEETP